MKSKKKSIIVLAVCTALVTGICTGCQPTPDESIVIDKNAGVMEEKIADIGAHNTSNIIPDRMEAEDITSNNGKLVIKLNADIDNPATQYPVYEVTPLKAVPEELLNRCAKGYFGDAAFYELMPLTQNQLYEIITTYKNEIYTLQSEAEDIPGDLKERMIHTINQKISQYESQLPDAPENVEAVPLNLQSGQAEIIGQADIGLPEPAYIGILNDTGSGVLRFSNDKVGFNANTHTMTDSVFEAPLPNLLYTTAEQATGQASELLERMGLAGDFVPFLTEIVQKRTQDNTQAEDIYTYCVSFTRLINGNVPVGEMSFGNLESEEFELLVKREQLNVFVDDTGVIQFDYTVPYETGEMLNENVETISYKEMQEVISSHLLNTFQADFTTFDPSFKLLKEEIFIEKIKLEYLIVSKKDDRDHRLLIPVWNVYGHIHSVSQIKEADGSWRDYDSDMDPFMMAYQNAPYQLPLISINAIDGSVLGQ
jgi:hypothetical protein